MHLSGYIPGFSQEMLIGANVGANESNNSKEANS